MTSKTKGGSEKYFLHAIEVIGKKNRSFIVTTKQKSIVDTQRIRKKDAKHTNMENHQFIKTNREKERKMGTTKQPENT